MRALLGLAFWRTCLTPLLLGNQAMIGADQCEEVTATDRVAEVQGSLQSRRVISGVYWMDGASCRPCKATSWSIEYRGLSSDAITWLEDYCGW